jgi:broad specificity phosphatase PhoE
MNIYFVRHGESELNAKAIHQINTTPLSEVGHQQAEAVANRLVHLPIEAVVASHYTRAQQTAAAIATKLELPITTSEYFKELDRPSSIFGLHYEDPKAIKTLLTIKKHHHNPDYRHSDEETFHEAVRRAHDGIDLIKKLPYEDVAIVSHGNFLRIIVGVMLFGDRFDTVMFDDMQRWRVMNTGITHMRYIDNTFYMVSWNDRNHFA